MAGFLDKDTGLPYFWSKLKALFAGKADKVSGATNGHFAGLDANGNLTDSGHKHSDYKAASAHDSWTDVTSKPFDSLNSGLFNVVDGELRTQAGMVTGMWKGSNDGSATSAGYRGIGYYFLTNAGVVQNWGIYIEFVMKQTATAASYTFTNSEAITDDRLIDVYSSIRGENPTNVIQTGGTVTVTFAESKARTVAIVLK